MAAEGLTPGCFTIHRRWCSDNSDAADRIRIQYGTSFGYPMSAVGAHVSAVPNHQTGRITPFYTRGIVAMAGGFGIRTESEKLSCEEKKEVREQISEYKKYAPLIQNGLYYRLTDPFEREWAHGNSC
ncbi:MAG: alpha-galactosidase [Eubacterium sp.]